MTGASLRLLGWTKSWLPKRCFQSGLADFRYYPRRCRRLSWTSVRLFRQGDIFGAFLCRRCRGQREAIRSARTSDKMTRAAADIWPDPALDALRRGGPR